MLLRPCKCMSLAARLNTRLVNAETLSAWPIFFTVSSFPEPCVSVDDISLLTKQSWVIIRVLQAPCHGQRNSINVVSSIFCRSYRCIWLGNWVNCADCTLHCAWCSYELYPSASNKETPSTSSHKLGVTMIALDTLEMTFRSDCLLRPGIGI